MTLANRITVGRLIAIPVFLVLVMSYTGENQAVRWAAFAVFVGAAISDGIDGYLARFYNQKTKLGAVLDPLADKLLINLAFVFLAVNQEFRTPIPYWFPVVMISRDAIIVIGAYLIHNYVNPFKRVRPRVGGKMNTVLQMSTIIAVLIEFPWAIWIIYGTVAVAIISFFDYLYSGISQIEEEERE